MNILKMNDLDIGALFLSLSAVMCNVNPLKVDLEHNLPFMRRIISGAAILAIGYVIVKKLKN
jgi:hypothetical protein